MPAGVPAVGPTGAGAPAPPAQPRHNSANSVVIPKASEARLRLNIARPANIATASNHRSHRRPRRGTTSGGTPCGPDVGTAFERAVVVTVVVIFVVVLSVKAEGETEHAPPGGALLQLIVIVSLKPPAGARVIANVAAWPAEIVAVVGEPGGAASEKSVPVPERAIVRGLPGALSVVVIAPFRGPVTVGVKVTVIVQLAPIATPVPQVLVGA